MLDQRPQHLHPVRAAQVLGGTSHVHFDMEGGSRLMASVSNDQLPDVGDTIRVRVPPERVHLFGSDGNAISNST